MELRQRLVILCLPLRNRTGPHPHLKDSISCRPDGDPIAWLILVRHLDCILLTLTSKRKMAGGFDVNKDCASSWIPVSWLLRDCVNICQYISLLSLTCLHCGPVCTYVCQCLTHATDVCVGGFLCVQNELLDGRMERNQVLRYSAAHSPFVSQQMKIVQSKLSGEQKKKKKKEQHFPLQRVLTGYALLNTILILRISCEFHWPCFLRDLLFRLTPLGMWRLKLNQPVRTHKILRS